MITFLLLLHLHLHDLTQVRARAIHQQDCGVRRAGVALWRGRQRLARPPSRALPLLLPQVCKEIQIQLHQKNIITF